MSLGSTLAQAIALEAPSGERVALRPNSRGDGIWFQDGLTGSRVPASAWYASRDGRATTLHASGCRFRRVEHLMSALTGAGVNHAIVVVNGDTVPLLDGSAMPWIDAILAAGTCRVNGIRGPLYVRKAIEVREGDRWVRATPCIEFRVRYRLDYPGLKFPRRTVPITRETYLREIAPARTFCGEHEAPTVRAVDPGDFGPVVVFDAHGRADRPLRFTDECVRHKLLDLVGDLGLVGRPIRGFIDASCSGHALHIELARRLAATARSHDVRGKSRVGLERPEPLEAPS